MKKLICSFLAYGFLFCGSPAKAENLDLAEPLGLFTLVLMGFTSSSTPTCDDVLVQKVDQFVSNRLILPTELNSIFVCQAIDQLKGQGYKSLRDFKRQLLTELFDAGYEAKSDRFAEVIQIATSTHEAQRLSANISR